MLFQLWLILHFAGFGKVRTLYLTRVSHGLLTHFEHKAIGKLLTSEQLRVHFLGPFQLHYTRTSEGQAWVSALYQVHPGVESRTWGDAGGRLCYGRCTHMAWEKRKETYGLMDGGVWRPRTLMQIKTSCLVAAQSKHSALRLRKYSLRSEILFYPIVMPLLKTLQLTPRCLVYLLQSLFGFLGYS